MADKWMDERDRRWRDRDWRQSEDNGRGREQQRGREDRSFGSGNDEFGARRSGQDRDRVFGEQESGYSYSRPSPGGGGYGAGSYGGGESYGRGAGGGSPGGQYGGGGGASDRQGRYQDQDGSGQHAHGRDWQGRGYQGVSPAMAHGEYDANRGQQGQGGQGMRFGSQDYTQGGRFYGDDRRQPIYREEWGQGGVDYTNAPRGYDAGGGGGSAGYQSREQRGGYGGGQGDWQDRNYGGVSPAMRQGEYDMERNRGQYQGGQHQGGQYGGGYGAPQGFRTQPAHGGTASGGTGGYDYERGYGDAGRRDMRGGGTWQDHDRHDGDRGGDFFYKAGQKVANWFRGNDLMQGSRPDDDRSYQTDYGRERRFMPEERGHRGMGPKGYKRSDERINEEVHERLTDDSWLDASNIDVHVKDGEVTLTGSVENREAKHRAERLVEDLSGVVHVQNNLRIMASNPLTGSGRGFGDSAAEAQMRRDDPTANGSGGAAGSTPGGTTSTTGGTTGTEDSASTRTTTRRT